MNATRHLEMFRAAAAADPLASLRMDATAIADLAFGSMSVDVTAVEGRHLAMLSTDALELDLDDPLQRQFGDYELQELIGEGGMGVVYRAHQQSLDRDVAIKLLAAGPWASKNFIERFQREAQNAARMQHPNIVAIYEVGSSQELHFFSMRLICGGSLADLIKVQGKLEPARAARLLRTIAEAVDYAHKLGVLHLDLKPANVLLDDNGNPHVADFGLARRLEQGLAADTNEVSGTPSYMAPEQCVAAQRVTPATDIWGLGAILYELVTGRPPYLGASPQATLQLVVDGEPITPREYEKNLPRDLEAIIRKCLVHDVSARYASARDLADDLGRFLAGYEVRARPLNAAQRTWRWARREPKLAVTALLALATLLIGLFATTQQWRRAETQKHLAQEQTQLAQKNEALSNTRLWESRRSAALTLQTQGKAFDSLPALVANIEERERAGVDARVERREVGMILSQGVTLIDRMIIADWSPITAALSDDGSLLAVGLNNVSVRWYDTATLSERGRVDLDQPTSDGTPRAPRLLRFVDNHRLLVTLDWFDYLASPANIDTVLVDLDRASVIAPPPAFANLASAVYSANGRYALLFDDQRHGQFWEVEPWRPLSMTAYNAPGMALQPWMVGVDGHVIQFDSAHQTDLAISDAGGRRAQYRHVTQLVNRNVTAWQESRDGRQLAVGDDEGHAWLVDINTAVVRELPLPAATAVTWLAFSEDDAWIAVARRDGDAFAFDAATGNPLHAAALQQDFELSHVAISRRENLLIASGAGDVALWRLPAQGRGGATPATRIAANPTRSARAGVYWAGASVQAGLLVTADMDGEVRLWRLPLNPQLEGEAAGRPADRTPFDGRHVIEANQRRIHVIATDGRDASPWATLPEPATFAELAAGGRVLLAASGRQLHGMDSASMRSLYAPVQLPGTPNLMAIRPDGTLAIFAFGQNNTLGHELRLQAYDPLTGRQQTGEAVVKGPLRSMEFSPDGSRLLVVGPLNGATEVFDSATLRRIGLYPHDAEQPVIGASFTQDVQGLWLVETDMDESEATSGRLLQWDPAANRVLEQHTLAGAKPIGLALLDGLPVLFTKDHFTLDPGGANEHAGPALRGGEVTSTFAATADEQLIAHAYGRDVQLYDAATLEAVGPPLKANWRINDMVLGLSFDAGGEHLLARMGSTHRLFAWPTGVDRRPLPELQRDAELLAASPRTRRVLRMADPTERATLRARDPGAWPLREPLPQPDAIAYVSGDPLWARSPHATPLQLDLSDHFTVTASGSGSVADSVLTGTYSLPQGIATLDGVDYDIRGAVELRGAVRAQGGHEKKGRAEGIRVPATPLAALDVLTYASFPVPEPGERVYARIRLHYRDGSVAVLPIRTQREVPGMTRNDRPTPIGWSINDLARIGVLPIQVMGSPRLVNPHPEKIIATLDLEAGDGWSEPVFIAITAEPVIAAGKSGSNQVQEGVK